MQHFHVPEQVHTVCSCSPVDIVIDESPKIVYASRLHKHIGSGRTNLIHNAPELITKAWPEFSVVDVKG